MADKEPIHLRGIEGKPSANGTITRVGVKAVVVLQTDDMLEALPMMYAASEADAKEYVNFMRSSGNGKGLSVVTGTAIPKPAVVALA